MNHTEVIALLKKNQWVLGIQKWNEKTLQVIILR